ncbi:MAG: hypothetical protein IT459_06345 [Planctomycetes bacterium]|nr:hypothetical protein [Planctomycetota bacterium]
MFKVSLLAIGALASMFGTLHAQVPRLRVNGVGAATNGAVAHAQALHELQIELRGTPGAAVALLVSADAFDGDPVGEPIVANGAYLRPFVAPGVNAPLHALVDGIGAGALAGVFGVAPSDVVSTGLPQALNGQGLLSLPTRAPSELTLVNSLTPGVPFLLPLESTSSATARIFLQAVERDPQTNQLRVGNGVIVVFDALDFPVRLAYSEGLDANPNGQAASDRQSLGTIGDANLGDATLAAFAIAPDFSGAFGGAIDLWNIELAGTHDFVAQSHASGTDPLSTSWSSSDPDGPGNNASALTAAHLRASGVGILAVDAPVLDVENHEFPRIRLPGHRQLFHWKQKIGGNPAAYGFGVLFEETGTFRNLVPASFGTFLGADTLSPFDWEVAVSPDGDFALVCLDEAGAPNDRAFLLDLRPTPGFPGGLPIVDVTPAVAADAVTIQEESFAFVDDGQGGFVAYFASSTNSGTGLTPNRLSRASTAAPSAATRVLPTAGGPAAALTRVDRQGVVASDHRSLAVIAGTAAIGEDVYVISSVTRTTETITNVTVFPSPTSLAEFGDARAQFGRRGTFNADGSRLAFAIQQGVISVPAVARTNGADAGLVVPLATAVTGGGQWDLIGDFRTFAEFVFTQDGSHLVVTAGFPVAGASSDRFDVFAIRIADGAAFNLTRTMNPSTLSGPFDIPATMVNFDRPTVDPLGSMVTQDGDHFVFVRDSHGLSAINGIPFDFANFVAIDLRNDPQTNAPSLRLTNITGAEFEPSFGVAPPSPNNTNVSTRGNLFTEAIAEDFQLRRIPSGPLANHYAFTARPVVGGVVGAYELFAFDLDGSGEAVRLTQFGGFAGTDGTPRIRNVVAHPFDATLAFTMDPDGASGPLSANVYTIAAGAPNAVAVTDPNAPLPHQIVLGSLAFTPTNPVGLVWAEGSLLESSAGATIDLVTSAELSPIDAGVRFHRFALGATIPAQTFDVTSPIPVGMRRSVMLWSAGAP